MSRDAQHRERRIAADLSAIVAARLAAAGYTPPPGFAVAVCPECDSHVSLRVNHDLINGDYSIECIHCECATLRSYFDPIEAIARWNAIAPYRQEVERSPSAVPRAIQAHASADVSKDGLNQPASLEADDAK